jgi:hypothetical protein
MIPLWKGKNHIYFGVITIIPFEDLYRRAYFVMHTFLVFDWKDKNRDKRPSFPKVELSVYAHVGRSFTNRFYLARIVFEIKELNRS